MIRPPVRLVLLWFLTALAICRDPVRAQDLPAASDTIIDDSRTDDPITGGGAKGDTAPGPLRSLVRDHCLDCHNQADRAAELDLESAISLAVEDHRATWENVIRRLRSRQMPPLDVPRPSESAYVAALAALESSLDRFAAEHPNPGRTSTFRRLTRHEYQNAIRDLLAIPIDAAALLPADEASHGFDNLTVSDLSPTLLDRYVSAAQKISRLAVGTPVSGPEVETFRVPADRTQEQHVTGLPIGTRGGVLIPYVFPLSGKYEIEVRLARDRNEEVEGLTEPHELELLLDRQRVDSFTVEPPRNPQDHTQVDKQLRTRVDVAAGLHDLGVTFVQQDSSLQETRRQPYQAHFNMHRHPRLTPAVFQVSITGPYAVAEPAASASRRRVFVCRPASAEDEEECARRILSTLARRAYRRPIHDDDLRSPLRLFLEGRGEASFDVGIEKGLSAILVSPNFLFRIEHQPAGLPANTAYRISDLELASRLSFFIWSSIPDDELLELAERGELSRPDVLDHQVRRMLADARSASLVTNFADQWLHLRNLDSFTPNQRLFPDFDDNLRQAFRQETESLFHRVQRQDLSVTDLLQSKITFLNERLAKHYGIPHVYGSRFRPVTLADDSQRGGLLRQGSILSVTSYATRTSPVLRGKWILENVLGQPPPPPPANIPALEDNTVASNLPVRERLAAHRANVACASCHNVIDPVGFALEHFDAVGRWREMEADQPVDPRGGLPDGSQFVGVEGLEAALLERPEWFVSTLTEKLLTFALGRGLESDDAPAVREIVRQARNDDYRFSSLVIGIAKSVPFQLRMTDADLSRIHPGD